MNNRRIFTILCLSLLLFLGITASFADPLTGAFEGSIPGGTNERDRHAKLVFSSGGGVSWQILGDWDYYDSDDHFTYMLPTISGSSTYIYSQAAGTLSMTLTWDGDVAATNDSGFHCTSLEFRTASSPLTVSSDKSVISGTMYAHGSYYYEGWGSWTDLEKPFSLTLKKAKPTAAIGWELYG